MEYVKGLNNLKFPATNKSVFVGYRCFSFRKRLWKWTYLNICIYILLSISLVFDNVNREKCACGHYKEEKHEDINASLFLTILTRKKAPAAAITTNKIHEFIH